MSPRILEIFGIFLIFPTVLGISIALGASVPAPPRAAEILTTQQRIDELVKELDAVVNEDLKGRDPDALRASSAKYLELETELADLRRKLPQLERENNWEDARQRVVKVLTGLEELDRERETVEGEGSARDAPRNWWLDRFDHGIAPGGMLGSLSHRFKDLPPVEQTRVDLLVAHLRTIVDALHGTSIQALMDWNLAMEIMKLRGYCGENCTLSSDAIETAFGLSPPAMYDLYRLMEIYCAGYYRKDSADLETMVRLVRKMDTTWRISDEPVAWIYDLTSKGRDIGFFFKDYASLLQSLETAFGATQNPFGSSALQEMHRFFSSDVSSIPELFLAARYIGHHGSHYSFSDFFGTTVLRDIIPKIDSRARLDFFKLHLDFIANKGVPQDRERDFNEEEQVRLLKKELSGYYDPRNGPSQSRIVVASLHNIGMVTESSDLQHYRKLLYLASSEQDLSLMAQDLRNRRECSFQGMISQLNRAFDQHPRHNDDRDGITGD